MSCKSKRKPGDLAPELLQYARRQISKANPLLLQAVYRLEDQVRSQPGPLSTDGVHLCYQPEQVERDFRKDPDSLARQLLHVLLHCLCGHLAQRRAYRDPRLFDIAADGKVWCLMQQLIPQEQLGTGKDLLRLSGKLSDLSTRLPVSRMVETWRQDLHSLRRAVRSASCFRVDDHSLWSSTALGQPLPGEGGEGRGQTVLLTETGRSWQQLREDLLNAMKGGMDQNRWGNAPGLLRMELEPQEGEALDYR